MATFGSSHTHAASRRDLDVAVGILVGLRGCSPSEAFDELVNVAHRTGLGIFDVSSSLAAVAAGVPGASVAADSEAFSAWGELIRHARSALAPAS